MTPVTMKKGLQELPYQKTDKIHNTIMADWQISQCYIAIELSISKKLVGTII